MPRTPSADELTTMMLLHAVPGLNDPRGGPNEIGREVYARMLSAIRGERARIATHLRDKLGLPDVALMVEGEPTLTVSCLVCGDTKEVRSDVAAAAGVEAMIPCAACAPASPAQAG